MTTMWLVELVPAFEEHPPFQTTYYAGYRFDLLNEAKTFDPNRAARFLYKYDADIAAMKLLPSKSCVWRAREHMFYDSGDDLDSIDPDCLPSC
jgi:hypothetical protein